MSSALEYHYHAISIATIIDLRTGLLVIFPSFGITKLPVVTAFVLNVALGSSISYVLVSVAVPAADDVATYGARVVMV